MEEVISRDIPLPIKRKVRQRCGFGCVVCGLPLYEYDHLFDFAKVKNHEEKEITLLCDQHHREKTSGLLPIDKVIEANKSPYNYKEGVSKPYDLHFSGDDCQVIIGNNTFSYSNRVYGTGLIPVCIDNIPLILFTFEDEHLFLTMNIFDEFNRLILQINENQLVYSISPWDIEFVGRNLKIREGMSKILIDFSFDVPNKITINNGRLLCNGVEIKITSSQLVISNSAIAYSGCTWLNCNGGIFIGPHQDTPFVIGCSIPNVSRYSKNQRRIVEE